MPIEPGQVGQLIETIWTVVLDCNVQSVPVPASHRDAASVLTSMVEFTGEWEGMLALECPEGFVRQAAALMFEIDQELVTVEQLEDSLCELTNIVGGNLKALLPPSTHLGLPFVAKDTNSSQALPRARVLTRLAYETSGFVFLVTIFSGFAASEEVQQQFQVAGPKS